MRDRTLAGALAVWLAALALRLGPLYWSPLPFNPDGVGYAALARDSLAAGRLPIAGMATDQVGYTAVLSVVAAVAGQPPLSVAQPVSAAIGATTVLLGVAVAARLASEWGWSPRRRRTAALLAGWLLAVEGVYLYRSMPTDEQTAGLLLVPVVVVVVDRWLGTGRPAWAAVAAGVGAVLPPLHNLTGLVGAFAVTCVLGVRLARSPTRSVAGRVAAAVAVVWVWALGYHTVTAAVTPAVVVQSDRIARVPGLFLAWVLLGTLGAAWFATTAATTRRRALLVGVVGSFGVFAANALRAVYPGTAQTPRLLLLSLLPLVVPLGIAALAAGDAGDDRTVVGLLAAPLALVGFALTARLSFEYLALAYRAQLFAHLPLLVLAGLATVVAVRRVPRSGLRVAVVAVVLVTAAASAPVAYAGLEALTYKGVTSEPEFGATAFATTHLDGWVTDDHLRRVTGYHGGNATPGPLRGWLRGGGPPPDCPVLAQRSWTTTGAQLHPQSPARLSPAAFRSWRDRVTVVYVATGRDPVVATLPRDGAAC